MTVTRLNYLTDATGHCSYCPATAPNENYQIDLQNAAIDTFVVPDYFINGSINFSYKGAPEVWIAINGTPTLPVAGTITKTAGELNPTQRPVSGGDIIKFITGNTNDVVGFTLLAK